MANVLFCKLLLKKVYYPSGFPQISFPKWVKINEKSERVRVASFPVLCIFLNVQDNGNVGDHPEQGAKEPTLGLGLTITADGSGKVWGGSLALKT